MTSALPHGLMLVNKPRGLTSHGVVSFLRKRLNISSVGHCGTLDPEAEGLMVMLIGEGTKLSQYLLEKDKTYILDAKFGMKTDSFDVAGQVLQDNEVVLDPEVIRTAVLAFQGEMEIQVPRFSAIKVKGEKLYDKARNGDDFEPPMKTMKFYQPEILEITPSTVRVQLSCSKGSYIRSWVHELGEKLGVGATMTRLIRTESQPYLLDQALTFEEIEQASKTQTWSQKGLIPLQSALKGWLSVRASSPESEKLLNNGQISSDLKASLIRQFRPGRDPGALVLGQENQVLAMIGLEDGRGFVIRRVFRY